MRTGFGVVGACFMVKSLLLELQIAGIPKNQVMKADRQTPWPPALASSSSDENIIWVP
jgi:hypothetical protein